MKKRKVLQVLATLNRGGIETWLKDVIINYNKERFQIDFLLTKEEGSYAPVVKEYNSNIYIIPLNKDFFKFTIDLYKILKKQKYDVVHAHPHFFSGYICLIAFIAGVSCKISHSHNDTRGEQQKSPIYKKFYFLIMRQLINIFSDKKLAASDLAGYALYGRKKSFQIFHCSIDIDKFKKGEESSRELILTSLNLPLDGIYVGHVGSFTQQKNHTFLLDIFKEIDNLKDNIYLLLIGLGPLQNEIKKKASELSLDKKILFLDERNDVNEFMKYVFDIYIFPSLFEGLGIVLLEAQASNLRCLISDVIPEEVDIIKLNRLSLNDSPLIWAKEACHILEQPLLDDGYVKIQNSDFNIQISIKKLEKLYSRSLTSEL